MVFFISMRNKKTLVFILFFCLLVMVAFFYKKIVIDRNYIVYFQIPCEEGQESCFADEGDGHTIFYRRAFMIEKQKDENNFFICEEAEKDCGSTLCDGDNCK